MNELMTARFRVERQSNGDVWISNRAFKSEVIVIPQSQCKELAELLWPRVEPDEEEWIPNYNRPPYKVDYSTRPWEPE